MIALLTGSHFQVAARGRDVGGRRRGRARRRRRWRRRRRRRGRAVRTAVGGHLIVGGEDGLRRRRYLIVEHGNVRSQW